MPGDPGFLGTFPLSSDSLAMPPDGDSSDLQLEPEAGVLCSVTYRDDRATELKPILLGAFNDCSMRRDGANKISEKKNWGAASKGFATRLFEVGEIDRDGATAGFRLACFLQRGEQTHEYGVDSALADYSYYGEQLLDWIVDRLARQTGPDGTPLEPVGEYLIRCGSPGRVLIGIGATRYTAFGESNFLSVGDESVVVVYDSGAHSPDEVASAVAARNDDALTGASVLRQVAR